jgi:hypothetical protein
MSDEPKRRRTWIWLALFVVFVLYPLSIGPASWLLFKSDFDPRVKKACWVIYLPISLLNEKSKTTADFFRWYAWRWVPD